MMKMISSNLAMQRLMGVITFINMIIFMLTKLFINTRRLMITSMLTPMIMFIIINTLITMFIIISTNTMNNMITMLNTNTRRNTIINTQSILMQVRFLHRQVHLFDLHLSAKQGID